MTVKKNRINNDTPTLSLAELKQLEQSESGELSPNELAMIEQVKAMQAKLDAMAVAAAAANAKATEAELILRSGGTVIVNGRAMSLHDQESSSPSSHRGYGGAIWNFETSDGRQFSSSNVWDNGELPTEWEIPDNVRTMTPRETFPELPDSQLVWEPIPDTLTSKEVIITMAKKPAKPVKSKPCK